MIHNEISNITVHEISIKNLSGEIFLKQKKKKFQSKIIWVTSWVGGDCNIQVWFFEWK